MSKRTLRPTREKLSGKSAQRRDEGGWGLTETLLTLGAMSTMAVAIYMVLNPTSASAQIKIEQSNLRDLSQAVDRSLGLLGTFEGVNADRIFHEELAPDRMRASGELRTHWGAPISIRSERAFSDHDAFVVAYPQTPPQVCAGLASAMARDAFNIRVNGVSVYDANGLNPSTAAQRCSAGNTTMEFVFHSGLVTGQAVAAAPVVLPPPPPTITPPPGAPPIITIPGTPEVDPVTPGTPAMPPPAAPPPVLPPPVTPPGSPPPPVVPPPTFNPPPPPVTPPGVVCSPPSPWVEYDNQAPNCAVNQYGVRTQRRSRNVSYSCPEAWDNPETTLGPWSSWADVTNTCTACPVLAPESQTQWLPHTGSCPAGQTGTVSHEYEQRRTRTRGHNCPAGTTTLPPVTMGPWGTWTNTGSTRNSVNTCAPICSAPAPSTAPISRPASNENRDVGCPAGQTGQHLQTRTRTENGTRTTSWTCPGPTSTSTDSWSGTYNYGAWTTTSNTCLPVGPPPNNGICPSRSMVTGCATYSVSTRTRVTPISIGEDNGAVFSTPGQYVRCTLGYADTIAADGFPSINGDHSRYRFVDRGGCGMTDWDSEYGSPEECSSYVRVFARNADGTNGQQCFGEAKIIFNWDSK